MISTYGPRDRERFIAESAKSSFRTDFARDRARIMYSSALRRLGAKTQVVGPSSDDFVRTRLTHSIEVSQVGRALGQELGCDPDIVDAACQAHDLGHPPFGHNGERALDEFFADIGGFEGNAQTFRIVTRIEPKVVDKNGQPMGLNLTRAGLDAICKYPWGKGEGEDPVKSQKKYSVYEDDLEVFQWMRAYAPTYQRCLEAQIMDISDDIAYSVHDVEDAVTTRAIPVERLNEDQELARILDASKRWYGSGKTEEQLISAWERLRKMDFWISEYDGSYAHMSALKDMTSQLIGRFCQAVAEATKIEAGQVPLHRYDADLEIPVEISAEIQLLKAMAVAYVMEPREYEPVYLQQRTLLYELADALWEVPQDWEEPYRGAYYQATTEAERRRALCDQLASLTDTSANRWHAQLCGMFRSL